MKSIIEITYKQGKCYVESDLEIEGNINSIYAALDNYTARHKKFSPKGFVQYINSKNVYHAKLVTKKEYDEFIGTKLL